MHTESNGNAEQVEREAAVAREHLTEYIEGKMLMPAGILAEIAHTLPPDEIQATIIERTEGARERAQVLLDFARTYLVSAGESDVEHPDFQAALQFARLATSSLAMENNVAVHNRHRETGKPPGS